MTALDAALAGLSRHDQITALHQLRSAIPARLQAVAAEHIRELVPQAVRATWTGDTSSNDDGTSTPYVSTLALIMRDGATISLPVETDLDCGIDWYEGMDFGGFADEATEDAFLDRLEAARFDAGAAASSEDLALAQIALSLGGVDVRALIGAMTTLAEEDPFGETYALEPSAELPSAAT